MRQLRIHSLTWWFVASALAIAISRANNPWFAIAVVCVSGVFVWRMRVDSPWAGSFNFALRLGVFIIVIRTLVGVLIGVPIPGQTLFTLPILDTPSWMAGIRVGGAVTLDRVSSAFHEGTIIASIIAIFGAASSLTSPRKILRALPFYFYEFGLSLVIATSLIPQLIASAGRIRTAHSMRGLSKPSLRRIALPLLEDSLAKSLELAAAMDSRGYGMSRKRSRFRKEQWTALDASLISVAIAAAVFV